MVITAVATPPSLTINCISLSWIVFCIVAAKGLVAASFVIKNLKSVAVPIVRPEVLLIVKGPAAVAVVSLLR
jgi:hypothetical protein